jgi:hypothetical protein
MIGRQFRSESTSYYFRLEDQIPLIATLGPFIDSELPLHMRVVGYLYRETISRRTVRCYWYAAWDLALQTLPLSIVDPTSPRSRWGCCSAPPTCTPAAIYLPTNGTSAIRSYS